MHGCYAGHEHGLLSQHLIRHGMVRVVSFPFKKSWRHTTLLQSLFEKKIERVAEAFRIIRSDDSFLFAHMKQKVKMADMFEHNGIFLYVLKRAPYRALIDSTILEQRSWFTPPLSWNPFANNNNIFYSQRWRTHVNNIVHLSIHKGTSQWCSIIWSPRELKNSRGSGWSTLETV